MVIYINVQNSHIFYKMFIILYWSELHTLYKVYYFLITEVRMSHLIRKISPFPKGPTTPTSPTNTQPLWRIIYSIAKTKDQTDFCRLGSQTFLLAVSVFCCQRSGGNRWKWALNTFAETNFGWAVETWDLYAKKTCAFCSYD